MLFIDKNVDDIECDESILVFNITKEVDSINFKNTIIQSILPFELPEFEKDIQEMIIEEEFGNDYFGNLIIQDYPNLQSIIVKKNSLMYLNSLMICNCEKLKTIEVEDGVFYNVKNVIIENYPNLQSIIVKKNSLQNLNSLKICNCENLKTIKIEDGVFEDVNDVIIESVRLFDVDISIFLYYNHS